MERLLEETFLGVPALRSPRAEAEHAEAEIEEPSTPGFCRADRWALALATAVLLASCTDEWRPVSFVEGLRVLAIRAEPAEIAPGETTTLTALAVDPRSPKRTNTLLWFACDPDPKQLTQPACAQYATFDDSSSLGAASTLPEGVQQIGFGNAAVYRAPGNVFSQLAAGDPQRQKGALAIVMLVAIAQPPPEDLRQLPALLEKVKNKEVDAVFTIKRLLVSERPAPNKNPALSTVAAEGEDRGDLLISPSRLLKLRPGADYTLDASAAIGSAQSYQGFDVDGQPVNKQERLMISWFTTRGHLSQARTEEGQSQGFVMPVPFEEMPASRAATLFLVLRDGRGGAAWMSRPIFFCDPLAEAPTVEAVEPAAPAAGQQFTLRGQRLEDALEVSFAGAIVDGGYDPIQRAWVGQLPELPPGRPPTLRITGRSCSGDPALSLAAGGL